MPTREADVRSEIAVERVELAKAMDELRRTDVRQALRAKLPLLAAGAFGVGFVLAGGIGAVARLVFRRSREGRAAARLGRYAVVYRR